MHPSYVGLAKVGHKSDISHKSDDLPFLVYLYTTNLG